MIGELNIQGVFVPTALVAAVIAAIVNAGVSRMTVLAGLQRWMWHRALFELATFAILLCIFDRLLSAPSLVVEPFQ
jgi:hypothetical protein